ncbi:MAG: ComEC/Rec2 family competence protein, partial [Candidatus Riflebacteria bacterium]|nr:ComEC/Rec2 family competence protein [Candidatus Riflebacteria bacterium]
MYISVATIMHLESSSSPIRPISIAAFFMLLYDPSFLKNAAFILSFTAVLSIIFLRQPFEYILSLLHLPKLLNRYLAVTFAANIGTMPMVAYIFGTLSLSSLFVNPLILWSFTIILPTSFAIAFLSIFSISTLYLSSGLAVLLDTLISFLEYVKSIPGLYFYVGNIKPITILAVYTIMLYITSIFNKWQIKRLKEAYSKTELDKIPVTQLPKEKTVEIHIDSKSKATPTLIGKEASVPKKENIITNKPTKPSNPLKNNEIIAAIDEILCGLKRIKIKNHEKTKEIIPVNSLVIDSQNIYYRLFEMDSDIFNKEPERLLQAHIFMLSIIGYELLNRLNPYLINPLPDEILEIEHKVKDKFLAVAIIADSIMNSNIPNQVSEQQMQIVLNQGKLIFIRAQKLLQQIVNDKAF